MPCAARLLPVLLVAAVSLACGNGQPAPTPTKVESDAAAEPAPAVAVTDGVPKITAEAAVYEFGGIKPSDTIEHVFKIRNAGTADLKIDRVQKT